MGIRHVGLKCLAVGLAALLWLVVSGEQIVERALRIPLEYTNLPQPLEMIGSPATVVDVRVRGSSSALSRLGSGDLAAVLDLSSARPGRRLFHLAPQNVRSPFGIDIVQVIPSNVSMHFEESASKVVSVIPVIEGNPADGFVVGTVSADPATVEVVGPTSLIEELSEAVTEPLSVAGARESVRERVNVGVVDTGLRLRAPQSSVVTVQVEPAPIQRVVADVTVRGYGTAGRPRPTQVRVAVRGRRDLVDTLTASGLDASVDVGGLAEGQYRLPVRVSVPPGVMVVGVEPAEVQVRVGN